MPYGTTDALRHEGVQELEPLQSFLWHGNIYRTLPIVQLVEADLHAVVPNTGHNTARKLPNAVEEFHTCIEQNKRFMPNYGERYRVGERISTGFVESTVNRVVWRRTRTRRRSPQICVLPFCRWRTCGAIR